MCAPCNHQCFQGRKCPNRLQQQAQPPAGKRRQSMWMSFVTLAHIARSRTACNTIDSAVPGQRS